jgi:hypothetical protein
MWKQFTCSRAPGKDRPIVEVSRKTAAKTVMNWQFLIAHFNGLAVHDSIEPVEGIGTE